MLLKDISRWSIGIEGPLTTSPQDNKVSTLTELRFRI